MSGDYSEIMAEIEEARQRAQRGPNQRGRRLCWIVALAGVLMVVAGGVLLKRGVRAAAIPLMDQITSVKWSSASSEPVPERFLFILFPAASSSALTSRAGAPVVLSRSVMADPAELSGGTINVITDGLSVDVPKSQLVGWIHEDVREVLIQKMVRERVAAGLSSPDFLCQVRRVHHDQYDEIQLLTRDSRVYDLFTYHVRDGEFVPVSWNVETAASLAVKRDSLVQLFVGVLVAGSGFLGVAVAGIGLGRLRMSSRVAAA